MDLIEFCLLIMEGVFHERIYKSLETEALHQNTMRMGLVNMVFEESPYME